MWKCDACHDPIAHVHEKIYFGDCQACGERATVVTFCPEPSCRPVHCDHKFVDSTACLKCGFVPDPVVNSGRERLRGEH